MTSPRGKLARDSFWMIIVQIYGRGLSMVFSLYAAYALGVENFGTYGYVMAIVAMISAVSDFGSNTYQVRQTAIISDKDHCRLLLSNALFARLALGMVGLIAIMILAMLLLEVRIVSWLIILFGLAMFFNNVNGAFMYTLIGREKFGLYGVISAVSQTMNMGAACLLIYLGYGLLGIGYAFLGWGLLSLILISLVVSKRLYSPAVKFSRGEIIAFLKGAAPIGLTALLTTIYYKSDYIILEYFRGHTEVGLYNAAYVILNALIFIPATISSTLLPRMSFFSENDLVKLGILYRHAFKYLLFAGFGLGFGTLAVSSNLIRAIYPEDFASAYLALNILIWALALIFVNSIQGSMIIAVGKQKLMPLITGSAAVVNIGLNLAVIPRYGIQGAAFTTVLAEIVAGGSCLYILRNFNGPANIMRIVIKTLIAGFSMYAFLLAIEHYSLFLRVPLGIVIYFAALVILKGLTKTDLVPLKEMLKRG